MCDESKSDWEIRNAMDWSTLQLISPSKFPSYLNFVAKWVNPNPEQEELRFNHFEESHIERGYN